MKRLLLLPTLLLLASSALAQSTTVSGQVTDSGAQSWNNGTITAVFVINPQYPTFPQYTWTGGTLSSQISGTLTGTGSYSISVPSSTTITPVNSQWRFQVCPQASFPCFYTSPTTITGATQTVNVTPPTILINLQAANQPVSAYSDSEVTGAALGSTYYNLTSATGRICTVVSGNTCTTWTAGAGGINFPVLAPNGSLAAPSYSFTNQAGTGLSFNPSDIGGNPTAILGVSGSSRFRCNNAGTCAVDGSGGAGVFFLGSSGTSGFSFGNGTIGMTNPTRFKLLDQGTCTMTAGTCTAQSFASTYTAAPLCFAMVTTPGGTLGFLKAPSTTTNVTPASSSGAETSTVNWICFGN